MGCDAWTCASCGLAVRAGQANVAPVQQICSFLNELGGLVRTLWIAGASLAYDDKGETGFDPVTMLDLEIERSLRSAIAKRFPSDRIWGEEDGWSGADSGRVWSLDPIDGTRALICGLPSWTVLVGVVDEGYHVAGMIDAPMLDERLIGCDGATLVNGHIVKTSGCVHLAEARMATTDPYLFAGSDEDAFARVRSAVRLTRYGLDALAYARVATGGLDLVIENGLKRHDYDALVAVVRGAGGHIGDWHGGSNLSNGDIVAAASAALYMEAVAMLSA